MWARCNKLLRQSLTWKKVKSAQKIFRCVETKRKWRSWNVWKEKSFCYVSMYMTTPQRQKACQFHCNNKAINISHTNQEISILMNKIRQSKVNTSSTSHSESQRKDKTENKGPRNKEKKNTKAVWTTVPASTAACMKVTSLSQLSHWLHQLHTVGKGQWKH